MGRTSIGLVAVALVLALAGCTARTAAPVEPRLRGLLASARVVTDRWGVPHVEATNLPDLYYLWGWVTARDRLWQIVNQRAAAEGRRNRWFGNSTLEGDGVDQLFRLRERAAVIWARDARDPALRLVVERYAAGINAYLADCREGRAPWPPELVELGERPRDWRPEDTAMLLLVMGVALGVDRSALGEDSEVREHGMAWYVRRHRFEDRIMYDTVPDSSGAPAAARAPHAPGRVSTLPPATSALAARVAAAFPARAEDGSDRASNIFAVGPRRSASGRPLVANDPHFPLATPGPFHVVHLYVPGVVDAAGGCVPGLPVIMTGRNRRCAWGITHLAAHTLDLYADSISADGHRVKGPAGWVPVIEQPYDLAYRVLGIPLPLVGRVRRYTPHGPVLVWDTKRHVAVSARWSALEDGRITLARMLGLERSCSADEVAARFRTLVTPTFNVVAADVDGTTLYQANGLVPRRGCDPPPGVQPGDGHHEWTGFIPADSMPSWHVPADGFVVNGNNRPAHLRSRDPWPGYDFPQDRALRMAQRLAGDRSVTLNDAISVQNDVVSRAAQRQVPALLGAVAPVAASLPPRARAALDTLRTWDYAMRRWLVAPTLASSWWDAYMRRGSPQSIPVPGLALAILTGEAHDTLRTPAGPPESLAACVAAALVTALDTLDAKLGPDLSRWTWGRAHLAHFRSPLATYGRGARFEAPRVPMDGDGSTVAVGPSQAPWNFDVTQGPVFRHVVDLADTSRSWIVIPPWNAASGATHTLDQRERWANHAYVPLDLDWSRIERNAASVVRFQPGH